MKTLFKTATQQQDTTSCCCVCDGLTLPATAWKECERSSALLYMTALHYYFYMTDCELAVVSIVLYFFRARQKHLEMAERLRRGRYDLGAKKALALLPPF